MKYPRYVEIDGEEYEINTDFRIAIKCSEVSEDDSIGELERGLAVIYLLFGDKGINAQEHYEKLLESAQKYLLCGKQLDKPKGLPDMDYVEDMDYIEASFQSDFGISLEDTEMHWWKFNKLINGLSDSEFGNCCILNRIRNLRTMDVSKIKDAKEKQKINEAKKKVALKKYQKKVKRTEKERKSVDNLMKDLGIRKE